MKVAVRVGCEIAGATPCILKALQEAAPVGGGLGLSHLFADETVSNYIDAQAGLVMTSASMD